MRWGGCVGLNVSSGSTIGELNINYIPVQGIQAAEKQGNCGDVPDVQVPGAEHSARLGWNPSSSQAVDYSPGCRPAAFDNLTEYSPRAWIPSSKRRMVAATKIKGYGGISTPLAEGCSDCTTGRISSWAAGSSPTTS